MIAALRRQSFEHRAEEVSSDRIKATDDVSGMARAAEDDAVRPEDEAEAPQGRCVDAPPFAVAELAAACVRFVATRYGVILDFAPETLSLLDQWLRDARAEREVSAEATELVQSAAGAYLGEVIRRQLGGEWMAKDEVSKWRLFLSTVYCSFNPVGMAREALFLEPADGWHAHFELDPGEEEAVESRIAALSAVTDEEYYAPSTRYDVLVIVVDALRADMRARGLGDVRFEPEDYRDVPR